MIFSIFHALILATADRLPLEYAQRTCLKKFTDAASETQQINGSLQYRNLWDHFMSSPNAANYGVCGFRGIVCTEGRVTYLSIDLSNGGASMGLTEQTIVDMAWLPPTIMSVNIEYTWMRNGWQSEELPRNLRTMRLLHCDSRRVPHAPFSQKTVNLGKLPRHMESLYVVGGWYRGQLIIDDLPATMEILYLSNRSFKAATVYLDGIPKGMKLVGIEHFGKQKVKIGLIGDKTTGALIYGEPSAIIACLRALGKAWVLG